MSRSRQEVRLPGRNSHVHGRHAMRKDLVLILLIAACTFGGIALLAM